MAAIFVTGKTLFSLCIWRLVTFILSNVKRYINSFFNNMASTFLFLFIWFLSSEQAKHNCMSLVAHWIILVYHLHILPQSTIHSYKSLCGLVSLSLGTSFAKYVLSGSKSLSINAFRIALNVIWLPNTTLCLQLSMSMSTLIIRFRGRRFELRMPCLLANKIYWFFWSVEFVEKTIYTVKQN